MPCERLHLVGDRDVGVQVRVPGAGVAVGERRGDQPAGLDLPGTAATFASEQHLALDEVQGVAYGGIVGGLDGTGDLPGRHRPQRRDRLHRAERQVVPGDRGLPRSGVAPQRVREFTVAVRATPVVPLEPLTGDLGASPGESGSPIGRPS